ncbi:MAG: SufE family protein [Chloroflexota bacterium]|nr:SufE family protein [Chloroflexota bacterium]
METYPQALAALVDDMASISDRRERQDLLIEMADRFDSVRVPPTIAAQPYPEANRAPSCESEAFVFAVDQPDGTIRYHFDVLNPQGLSAMAMAVILGETLSGKPLDQIAAVPTEIVFKLFGKELSMGKGAGLMGIMSLVQAEAKRRIKARG